ncbi:MAG: hypothetical protein CR988_03505 [Treponema sp.]|nr:MAG: hypothetical protein CR988_03505 [Treponema sp.]
MRKFWFVCFFVFVFTSLSAYEVDEKEIRQSGDKVEFINYTGKHSSVDSVSAITGIGKRLAGAAKSGKAGVPSRYYVVHAVDKSVEEGFDADILFLGKNAKVDHIDNLRLIISGYLRAAYGYSAKDANTIAHFVTIYNAVYRKNMNNFNAKYKEVVTKNLTAEKVGLALNYSEWPGNSQIVIPLSDSSYSGTLSTVDTSTISEKEVVKKMQTEKDKDIPVREDMIDLKERESKEAEDRAKVAQKDAAKKEKEANKAKKAADDEKKKAAEKQKAADEAKKKAEKTNNPADKKVAKKKAKEAQDAKKKADAKDKEAKSKKKDAKAAKDKAAKEQKFADKKEEEAQSDRKDVAADTQKIIEEKANEKKAAKNAAIASSVPGYGLKVVEKSTLLSELVLMDIKTAKVLKTSAVDTIHGRELLDANGRLMAIAGSDSGAGVVTLVLFDPLTLEVEKQGNEDIASESVLAKDGDDYYAVIDKSGSYYLGRFDADLQLKAKSDIKVQPYTPVIFTDKGIMVQTTDNSLRLLKKDSLANLME